MNIAPGPQAQVNIVRHTLAGFARGDLSREGVAQCYNAFAEVDGYGLPTIKHFLNDAAARAALERLAARLRELFGDEVA
jgi:hypothetical protein